MGRGFGLFWLGLHSCEILSLHHPIPSSFLYPMLMMMMVKSLINYQWEHFQNFRDKNGLLPHITQVPYGTLVDSWHTFSFTSVTDGTLVCLAGPLIVWSVTKISRRLLMSVTDQTIKGSARMWISSWYLTFWSRYILKSWYPWNVHFIATPPAPGILGLNFE